MFSGLVQGICAVVACSCDAVLNVGRAAVQHGKHLAVAGASLVGAAWATSQAQAQVTISDEFGIVEAIGAYKATGVTIGTAALLAMLVFMLVFFGIKIWKRLFARA